MLITVFFNEELEAESRFHLINVIQFLPGKEFNLYRLHSET